jgi:hypothetical protein
MSFAIGHSYMNKTITQKITPHLWFDNNAEEAAKFYASIFKNQKSWILLVMEKQGQNPLPTIIALQLPFCAYILSANTTLNPFYPNLFCFISLISSFLSIFRCFCSSSFIVFHSFTSSGLLSFSASRMYFSTAE